jgi:hypothetical protein
MATMPKLLKPTHDAGATPSKSTWETIVTLTPVALTLLATVLAGLSSSEMIQAQYYRSMAAQNQSKAGDQWGFFQAKRIRSTIVERLLDAQPGVAARVEAEQLSAVVQRLADRFSVAEQQTRRVLTAAPAGQPLHEAADKLLQTATASAAESKKDATELAGLLGRADVKAAFAYLGTDKLPPVTAATRPAGDIEAAQKAISDRQAEEQLVPLLAPIDASDLQAAVEAAATNAKRFEDAAKGVDQSLGGVDSIVRRQRQSAHAYHRAAGALETALADVPADKQADTAAQAAGVARADAAVQRTAEELNDYRNAREDYTARRNEREARNNQSVAGLYELQVHKSSITSEKHRRRSKNFFYGMLCAQAGVAISSLALAARRRSTLWGLAGLAGLTALIFSIYIYLYV